MSFLSPRASSRTTSSSQTALALRSDPGLVLAKNQALGSVLATELALRLDPVSG